jgi:hypothetical protein
MLDDPPTCPVRYRHQVVYGAVVAGTAFVMVEQWGWLYYLPAALLLGNGLEAGRRALAARQRRARRLPVAAARARAAGVTGAGDTGWERPGSFER